ncbi:MAG: PqqD family protein [Oscillospiraceae bacterium]|nr:PqqD family protein [Oscillospiraceae bacterium]
MKLKDGVIFSKVADETVVVTVGEAAEAFRGMIKLNSTGTFIAENMLQEITKEDLVATVRREYEIDEATAVEAVEIIIGKFQSVGLIKE